MNGLFFALELSASFLRCESQSTETERLRRWLGVSGASLCSYTFESDALSQGVPQGAVLGPTVLALDLLPLFIPLINVDVYYNTVVYTDVIC